DLEVKRDGSVIGRAAWGTAMPVDPGDHVVEASAQGKVAWKQSVAVAAKSDSKTVTVPVLENATASPVTAPVSSVEAAPSTNEPKGPNRAPALVAMGFGVVGLGVGSVLGLRAMSQKKTADDGCPNDQCTADGARANSEAIKAANLATVGFGVGIV